MGRVSWSAAAAVLCLATPALSAPFACPHKGGDFTFGQEANINSLDQMTSTAISTRNVAMNIFETLLTRDENNHTITDLADSFAEAPDHLTITFKLRTGIKFHNGKTMTSADVGASFDRYKRVGIERFMLDQVDHWDMPDPATFVIHMKKAQPTFLDQLSSFSVPIVIIPSENANDPPQQLHAIGTGPWKLDNFTPGSQAKLSRYDGYQPNAKYDDITGFGGYKQACFDTVTFRIVTEGGARVAGLQTGELQGVEDVPPKSVPEIKNNKSITLLPLNNWWIQIAIPNITVPPTNNLAFRKAVQAALDMDEIMDAASDGNYKLNVGFQYPNQPDYTDAGKDSYNLHDPAAAKKYLAEAGYKGEPLTLLTNKDYASMYNAAVVVQQELQAVGINVKLDVVDWPTSIQRSLKPDGGWNMFFSAWGTQPALGGLATMTFFAPPNAVYAPASGKDDPDVVAAFRGMTDEPTEQGRQEAFVKMQKLIFDRAYAYPFGSLTKVQATLARVKGFRPFRIPRMSNVYFSE